MKKWPLFFAIYFCICLLAACAASGNGPVPGGTPSNEAQSGGETCQSASVTAICRVVSNDGSLLLAGMDRDMNINTLIWPPERR